MTSADPANACGVDACELLAYRMCRVTSVRRAGLDTCSEPYRARPAEVTSARRDT